MKGFNCTFIWAISITTTFAKIIDPILQDINIEHTQIVHKSVLFNQHDFHTYRKLRVQNKSKVIQYNNQDIVLEPVSNIFHEDAKHIEYHSDGTITTSELPTLNCLFKGYYKHNPTESNGFFSFCNNQISGFLQSNNDADDIVFQSLQSNPDQIAIYPRSALSAQYSCGLEDQNPHEIASSFLKSINSVFTDDNPPPPTFAPTTASVNVEGRDTVTKPKNKIVEIILVNGALYSKRIGSNVALYTAQLMGMVQSLYDNMSADYQITFAIKGIVTMNGKNQFHTNEYSAEVNSLLSDFNIWRQEEEDNGNLPEHDVGHFLSGADFYSQTSSTDRKESVVGLANVEGVCGDLKSSVTQATSVNDVLVSSVMAHELGHNLGLRHADEYADIGLITSGCQGTYVMSSISSSNTRWSSCSRLWLKQFFEGSEEDRLLPGYGKSGYCLENKPTTEEIWLPKAVCGNGIREPGEDCDCKSGEDCGTIDPCCDPKICKLRKGATCSAMDPCCNADSCSVHNAASNILCHNGNHDECDKDVYCDGTTATCPIQSDVVGNTCANGGACYQGQCVSYKEQCIDAGPLDADEVTYIFSGPASSIDGNGCGNLQCRYSQPLPAGDARVITDENGVLTVLDGTPCGTNGLCLGVSCMTLDAFKSSRAFFCKNGIQDPDETDIDCGGVCSPCIIGNKCVREEDCTYPSTCSDSNICEYTHNLPEPDDTGVPHFIILWMEYNIVVTVAVAICIAMICVLLGLAYLPCKCLIGEERDRKIKERRRTVTRSVVDRTNSAAMSIKHRATNSINWGSGDFHDLLTSHNRSSVGSTRTNNSKQSRPNKSMSIQAMKKVSVTSMNSGVVELDDNGEVIVVREDGQKVNL